MDFVKELIDKRICVSFAQARRLVASLPEQRIKKFLNIEFGRKPEKSKLIWPSDGNGIHV